jgi:hypothetical protein
MCRRVNMSLVRLDKDLMHPSPHPVIEDSLENDFIIVSRGNEGENCAFTTIFESHIRASFVSVVVFVVVEDVEENLRGTIDI